MSIIGDFLGTLSQHFRIGLNGVRLRNSSGNLAVRNTADTADASVTASTINVSGDSITINSDAGNTGTDRSLGLARSASQTTSFTLTFPTTIGSPNQVLQTDGVSGLLSWVTPSGGSAAGLIVDTTSLAFGSTSPLTLFTLPGNAVIQSVRVIVDTAFNGTPSLSVGITGTTSKYVASNQVDLATATTFEIYPSLPANASSENLIATYSAGGATTGSARIEVEYVTPA